MAKYHKPKVEHKGHTFNKKVCHWDYCSKCGLVALKNEPTARAIALGCDWETLQRSLK